MKILTIGFLILVMINGQLNANEDLTQNRKITLNLDGASEVLAKGFIAPIEYTQYDFHVEWDELANLRVAEPEKWYPTSGFRDYTVVEIDATAFEKGGVLTIDISVGHAEVAGSFDLFDGESEPPTEGAPRNAVASAWGVSPGKLRKITHLFHQGQHFKLGATGDWHSNKGQVSAFMAKISVEPN